MLIDQRRQKIVLISGLSSLFLIAFLVRLIGLNWGIPGQALVHGMYLPDEISELISSLIISEQKYQFNIIRNQPFFYFTSFSYFFLYFLLALLTGRVDSWSQYIEWCSGDIAHFLIVGRLLVVVLGAVTVIVVFFIAKRLFSPLVGWAASLFLLFSIGHIIYSRILRLDSFMPFLVAVSLYLLVRIMEDRPEKLRYYILTGAFVAATAMTKVTGFAMLAPFFLLPFLSPSSSNWLPIRRPVFWKQYKFSVFVFFAAYFAFAGPSYIFRIRGSSGAVSGGASTIVGAMANRFSAAETYRNLGGISTFDHSLFFHLTESLPRLLGWPIYILGVIGFMLLIFERRKRAAVILLLTSIIAFLAPIGYLQRASDRDMLPLLPLLTLCAAYGLVRVFNYISDRAGLEGQYLRKSIFAALLLIVLIWPAVTIYRSVRLMENADTRELAAGWIEESVPANTALALEPYGPSIVGSKPTPWSTTLQEQYQEAGLPTYQIQSLLAATTSRTDVFKNESFLPFIEEKEIEYVVLSSAYYGRFYSEAMEIQFPEHAQQGKAFHDLIERRLDLVHTIYPNWRDTPGPIIKIYQVPDFLAGSTERLNEEFDPYPGFDREITAIGYDKNMVP